MRILLPGALALVLLAGASSWAAPLGTSFTYQGELTDAGAPVAGSADFRFTLHDALAGGTLFGSPIQLDDVAVAAGRFTVTLDFGDAWDGDARWLEVEARTPHDPTDTQPFTLLTPRQPLTALPYAQHAANGNWVRSGNAITNENVGFVGVNRDYPVGSEWFGVHAPTGDVYGGMYISTQGTSGKPFYGYYTGTETGWHYLDGATGDWRLNLGGDRVTVTDNTGYMGIGTTAPDARLQVVGEIHGDSLRTDGVIHSTSGGFRFPDGTMQATAVTGAIGDGSSLDAADGSPVNVVQVDNVGATAITGALDVAGQVRAGGNLLTDGRLGVGTGSASFRVDVRETSGTANVMRIDRQADAVANSDLLELQMAGASAANAQFIEAQLATGDVKFRVNADGNITADGLFTGGGADFAEMVEVTSGTASVEAGDVMVIDPDAARGFTRSADSRSTLVAGIYSTAPGFLASEHDWDQLAEERGLAGGSAEGEALSALEIGERIGEVPLAVVGIVPCKVSAENGPIRAGDLLVTSGTPGHAMRDENPRAGTIVGKALGSLSSGTGVITVLVTLQ